MKNQKTILIAEDEVSLLHVLRMKFEKEGYKVQVATNGEEVLSQTEKEKPDIIVLDLVMPRIKGIEVMKKLQAKEETKNIPVIILTNSGDPKEIEIGYKLGAVDYLVKADIKLEEVSEKVKRALEKR